VSAERLKLLTAALRSDTYTQGKDTLRNDGGFCCLGVACDIYMKETGDGEWSEPLAFSKIGARNFIAGEDSSTSLLPYRVADWYGINCAGDYDSANHVAMLNDRGVPFTQIADIIDAKVEDMLSRPWNMHS